MSAALIHPSAVVRGRSASRAAHLTESWPDSSCCCTVASTSACCVASVRVTNSIYSSFLTINLFCISAGKKKNTKNSILRFYTRSDSEPTDGVNQHLHPSHNHLKAAIGWNRRITISKKHKFTNCLWCDDDDTTTSHRLLVFHPDSSRPPLF